MPSIFVSETVGGVRHDAATNGFVPHNATGCPPLFFPDGGCARIEASWLNTLISEIGQAVDGAGLALNCGRTDNLNKAIMTHALTRGWCGESRAAAEAQKGAALVPGEFYLNTDTGTVYLIDADNAEWALPNQPSSFLCCGTGDLWANCGGEWRIVNAHSPEAIPAANITVADCPGPIEAGDLQTALCSISSAIGSTSGMRAVYLSYTGPGRASGAATLASHTFVGDPVGSVSGNSLIISQPGRYHLVHTADLQTYTYHYVNNIAESRLHVNGQVVSNPRTIGIGYEHGIRGMFAYTRLITLNTNDNIHVSSYVTMPRGSSYHYSANVTLLLLEAL